MNKGFKIMSLLVFLLAFAACEKCQKPVMNEDPFYNATNRSDSFDRDGDGGRGGDDIISVNDDAPGSDGDIVDPNEDEDNIGIVDPDEDEDFDGDDDGK